MLFTYIAPCGEEFYISRCQTCKHGVVVGKRACIFNKNCKKHCNVAYIVDYAACPLKDCENHPYSWKVENE